MESILVHPTYFPSIAQMVAISQAEKVIFEVSGNYQKQSYRTRAYIAHSNGKLLLNVPIKHTGERQKSKDIIVENEFPWQSQHWKSLETAYRTSPFFEFYEDELYPLFNQKVSGLLDHNLQIFDTICELIELEPSVSYTEEYSKQPENVKNLRYLAKAKKEKPFQLAPYYQVFESNHGFLPNLSILDLLFNEGPNTLNYLQQQEINL
ncbi:WbqC family protein [uncultured Marixanthomonas sp.]|uniref:WbqC family protein n=1 Tax=uncultured Marixanthomonas sp. TaxID=757245 RepID=UPI0030DD5BEF|tara:strand:+ start:67966 stop:68586 length:621 start_codon:yes stop_codon:yes gene_type:complete